MSYGYIIFNYNVFIHLNHVHVLLMFLFICTEINQIKNRIHVFIDAIHDSWLSPSIPIYCIAGKLCTRHRNLILYAFLNSWPS